eukprot:CAMPEP_0172623486 /NCGR_PEP_ID=MMETSP1068-20121228/129104_1 /TAXON_ID=35684 /ORGANISM="Pseudopedinella elastica, Strain CCMP716" /LENGTH=89 /DNA_ID=CAMNT_0013432063 /DNA_START=201 /DNA_END=467 /DNA_ORIENTATION=-
MACVAKKSTRALESASAVWVHASKARFKVRRTPRRKAGSRLSRRALLAYAPASRATKVSSTSPGLTAAAPAEALPLPPPPPAPHWQGRL